VLFVELGFNNKYFFNNIRCSSVTGRSGRSLLYQTAEDEMQFAVGMYHLLYRSLSVVFQVQDILGNAFKGK